VIDHAVLKAVHVGCVVVSYGLFFVRGLWMIGDSSLLRRRWARILPHVNDTLLLAAAIALAVTIKQYPLTDAWLTAKVTGLVAYIGIGTVAMKAGRPRRVRIAAWVAAQCVFFYIVAVALTRNPWPWM
jgi:uncharacterized membrane protein SirB2